MFTHILVPLAPPLAPKTALMTAAALGAEQSAHVTLLCVIDKQYNFPSPLAMWNDRKRIAAFLADAAAIVSEYGALPLIKIARGTPAYKAIKTVAEKIGADAIILGTQRRAAHEAPGHGLLTEALLGETDIPVLVIHESPLWKSSAEHYGVIPTQVEGQAS